MMCAWSGVAAYAAFTGRACARGWSLHFRTGARMVRAR